MKKALLAFVVLGAAAVAAYAADCCGLNLSCCKVQAPCCGAAKK